MVALEKQSCTGCGVCANICPTSAIQMIADEEGFSYPKISRERCLECGECVVHCPVYAEIDKRFTDEGPLAVYAAWSRDEEMRKSGSSGSIFGELAKEILIRGGYVAGVAYTSAHRAEHRLIHKMSDLPALKKSKYLQSDTGDIYSQVLEILNQGKEVLFVGTPCQCAGLLSYLGGAKENLFLCDFVCHGVNSPMVHQKYIAETEKELGIDVKQIDHRNKKSSWQNYCFSVTDGRNTYNLGGKRVNPFLRGFLTNLFLRPSCYECRFKGSNRPTDLTLGDCWGYPGDEPKGVSLVIVQSEKGQRLLSSIEPSMNCGDYSLKSALDSNSPIVYSAADKWGRYTFFSIFRDAETKFSNIIYSLLGEKYHG
jgi:coenzyme F420-reducing hydrogenase beta subunit